MLVAAFLLAFCTNLPTAAVAMVVFGVANGPIDIGLFALRQRRTDPGWLGRAFTVSMAMNFIGVPVGSALGGPVLAVSVTGAFLLMALANVAGALLVLVIPSQVEPTDRHPLALLSGQDSA
jgi:predicted MFS family arabinose efflux permease